MSFSFWSRKSNKPPSDIPLQPSLQSQDVELSRSSSRTAHLPNVLAKDDPLPEILPAGPEAVVAAVPNPHDAAVFEIYAKLLQAEQLSSTAHLPRATDPLTTDAARPSDAAPEPFFDPATGEQRGFFRAAATGGSDDSGQLPDEAWTQLARIRQIQSEIATMHRQMEGVGEESGAIAVEVDNDVDADTVPTQEEEDAANRDKEFERLPGKFKGRSDNIDAIMTKLNDLSQAVTSFHALQPPPLSFDSTPTSRQTTYSDISAPSGSRATPASTVRTRPPTTILSPKVIMDQKPLHESPITTHDPYIASISEKL